MPLKLHNTLTNEKEPFEPQKRGKVSMYNCGPTVYNFAHIGNLRTYVFADTLKRVLQYEGFEVEQIINITDVGHLTDDEDQGEDKIEEGARREKKSAREIADFYTKAFLVDIEKIGIDVEGTKFPKATEHIREQIDLIKTLENKGYTYRTSDGVYFDSSKFEHYGKLGNIDVEGLKEGARIEKNPERRHLSDFALWKFSPKDGKKREQEWDSPWGVGFPGWHIECSAMAIKYLGETLDIHTGGVDHIPVHHNNEIAQSESATGKPFAKYWIHGAHMTIDHKKISKSSGNFILLKDLKEKRIGAFALRYFFLGGSYRTQMNFTWESLEASHHAYRKLLEAFGNLSLKKGNVIKKYQKEFQEAIEDDLNTPKALAVLWEVLKDRESKEEDKRETILDFDKVLGLRIEVNSKELVSEIPAEIEELVKKRNDYRASKQWKEADDARVEIEKAGFQILDTEEGAKVKRSV